MYHIPPPSVIKGVSIDPVVPELKPKSGIIHLVLERELSLYNHEHPFDDVGKLENLPVPSFHDCDIANTSIFCIWAKFLCSVENNSKLVQKSDNNQENLITNENLDNDLASKKIMPGTSQPQDLGTISYKDMTDTNETQAIQSVETTQTILTENFINEEKILPDASPLEQYEFATSFLKVGDYNMAERAFREFVDTNPDNDLSGNAQYWYAETFRIRQLYTDAASAYLEGYQKYPKSEKAPINLLKLGVSLVQIGEKDQGCLMIAGVKKQYPNATQSVLQKAKYEEKKFECNKENS